MANCMICRLVLWNRDVEHVKSKAITVGTTIKIINGYTKQASEGIEINLGRWGLIEIEPEIHNDIVLPTVSQEKSIKGILVEKEPTRAFFRDNGDFGFVTTITIQQGKRKRQITLWDTKVKDIQQYRLGDEITLKGVNEKQKNGSRELHLNGNGSIQ